MNSTIINNNSLYNYYTITNAEFSGVLDKYNVHGYTRIIGRPETDVTHISHIYDYHLFIKYGDKVYMDVKGIGDIVISFTELQKNKYWKYYYDLSLMLTNNKHLVIEDLEYSSNYPSLYIYEEKRVWSINTAYIDGSYDTKTKMVVDNEYNCYYKINPHDLENMEYASPQKLNNFKRIYMSRYEIRSKIFDIKSVYYYMFVCDYCLTFMEKELEELSTIFEDKKNVINLATLNDKDGMNNDLLMIIYNNLISDEGNKKYEPYMEKTNICKNRLKLIDQIMNA
jgi:hypothetical protein